MDVIGTPPHPTLPRGRCALPPLLVRCQDRQALPAPRATRGPETPGEPRRRETSVQGSPGSKTRLRGLLGTGLTPPTPALGAGGPHPRLGGAEQQRPPDRRALPAQPASPSAPSHAPCAPAPRKDLTADLGLAASLLVGLMAGFMCSVII